jgi:hypothetical protein
MAKNTDEFSPVGNGSAQHDEHAIRERAYEISLRDDAGSPEENWERAIGELGNAEREGQAESSARG